MFFILIISVFILDQITKIAAVKFLMLKSAIEIIPNIFHLRYAENRGAAFSLFSNYPQLLTIISLILVPILLIWGIKIDKGNKIDKIAFGLICGGAIGNVFDRVVRGYVIDFIDVHWKDIYHWPTFNIADSAICIGIGFFIYANFFRKNTNSIELSSSSDNVKEENV